MSMYPWHGSTANTSTSYHTHSLSLSHSHSQQQQQQQQKQHQQHQQQHHPHRLHHTANTAAAAAASNSRIDSASTTTTATSDPSNPATLAFPMSQMRWLPSMISARTNPQHAALPNLSTNLRMQQQPTPQQPTAHDTPQNQHHHSRSHTLSRHSQQQQQQQQPVSVIIDARQQPQQQPHQQPSQRAVSVSSDESEIDHSDSGRNPTTADALENPDYGSSDNMNAKTLTRAQSHARAQQQQQQQQQQQRRHGHRSVAGGSNGNTTSNTTATTSHGSRSGPLPNGNAPTTRSATNATTTILIDDRDDLDLDPTAAGIGADNSLGLTSDREGPRKHGKRLTTLEEVSLFNICNRHAHEFGQRSNLCKWWMTVTEEFTRDQGHPYSWHSVRRKVELVTKQRMKFLDEQRERGGSESDDRSNPRWRAAVDAWIPTWQRWEEAEARRIEKRDSRRPRKRKDRGWETWDNNGADGVSPTPGPGTWRATERATESQSFSTPEHTKVRLPPGFDTMFASQPQSQHNTPTALGRLNGTPGIGDTGTVEPASMMSAMLETLGKLNRHLDAANSTPTSLKPKVSETRSSRATQQQQQQQQQQPPLPSQSQSSDSESDADPSLPTQSPDTPQLSSSFQIPPELIAKVKAELRQEMRTELAKDRASLEERLDSVQRTQEMILEMLRQEPS
ncbi:uncharacterized protein BP01DRAFT_359313 [Aspergillus saccharolyticus JOP 1030-1]|uniref:Sex determining protein n=1 Tax=Aspergillus saccharolyticus JOP 1030-1 TaxID=1450539 RepID=A0A318Z676_9EURO|nr:hypothetical protein BP01DRAFT_359313 [Aspergillus saccharolyticus JOP 1030-1]PYH42636.1 hypothetical protein BP01DRAFT_359313 [Aspergillus saccharolyticus JOP 1030-1]